MDTNMLTIPDMNMCSSCKTEDGVDIITIQGHFSGLIESHVSCGNCGMRGPISSCDDLNLDMDQDPLTEMNAIAVIRWNKIGEPDAN